MRLIRKILMAVIAFFLVELYIDSNMLVVSKINIKDKKIPESFNGYKILHLSDLHSKSFGDKNVDLISKIDEINPDLIVITGDMVNCNDTNFDNFFNLAKALAKKYKIYYIVGNHEQNMKEENKNTIFDFLKANGIMILDNEKAIIEKNEEEINLYGSWCNLRYYSARESGEKYDLF